MNLGPDIITVSWFLLLLIKVVREITGLGLKEAKDAVDGAPKVIKEQADKASAEDAKAKLEAEGAKVTLK